MESRHCIELLILCAAEAFRAKNPQYDTICGWAVALLSICLSHGREGRQRRSGCWVGLSRPLAG